MMSRLSKIGRMKFPSQKIQKPIAEMDLHPVGPSSIFCAATNKISAQPSGSETEEDRTLQSESGNSEPDQASQGDSSEEQGPEEQGQKSKDWRVLILKR